MPPRSLAEQFLDENKETDNDGHSFLVVYDFHGEPPSSRFYTNLDKLKDPESQLIQYSVFYTNNRATAQAVKQLATHYGAEALVFKGNPV